MGKKMVGIVLMVLGVGSFMLGSHMLYAAQQGEGEISQAESEQGQRRPRFGPVRRSASAEASENAEQRINYAGQEVAASAVTANWVRGIGVVLFVAGIGCFVFSFSRKNRG